MALTSRAGSAIAFGHDGDCNPFVVSLQFNRWARIGLYLAQYVLRPVARFSAFFVLALRDHRYGS